MLSFDALGRRRNSNQTQCVTPAELDAFDDLNEVLAPRRIRVCIRRDPFGAETFFTRSIPGDLIVKNRIDLRAYAALFGVEVPPRALPPDLGAPDPDDVPEPAPEQPEPSQPETPRRGRAVGSSVRCTQLPGGAVQVRWGARERMAKSRDDVARVLSELGVPDGEPLRWKGEDDARGAETAP